MATTLVRAVCCRAVTGLRPASLTAGASAGRARSLHIAQGSGRRATGGTLLTSQLHDAIRTKIMAMSTVPMNDILFRQLFDQRTCTYTYLIADIKTKETVLIDPVQGLVDRDIRIITDLDLKLIYGINTHVHADHVTGTGELRSSVPTCRSVIAAVSGADADVKIKDGDTLKFGKFTLDCRSTPGHTSGCMTYVLHEKEMAFTGDALLIRGCGRTDFQEGSAELLYNSVHSKILSLPGQFRLYPGHDYTGQTVTTVEEELKLNPRLSRTKEEFVKLMSGLDLPYPRFIDKALPANMVCGTFDPTQTEAKP